MSMIIAGIIFFWLIPLAVGTLLGWYVYIEFRFDRVPILVYHHLVSKEAIEKGEIPDNEPIWVCFDTEFAKQMDYLRDRGYNTLDMDDYVKIRTGQIPRPDKPVIVTFDDGYLSNYTLAYPVLKSNAQKATIFVVLEPDEHSREHVEGIDDFLTPDQMQEMADHSISIQSHTLTHCILPELDDDKARYELTESRERIKAITSREVEHIAIPRAGYSRRIRRLVKQVGYKTACGANKGTACGFSDALSLPRLTVDRDTTIEDFARCLTPQGGLTLRLVGNLKRIPERLGGARFAYALREILYNSPLRPLFSTRNLKRMMIAGGGLYFVGVVLFTWHVLAS